MIVHVRFHLYTLLLCFLRIAQRRVVALDAPAQMERTRGRRHRSCEETADAQQQRSGGWSSDPGLKKNLPVVPEKICYSTWGKGGYLLGSKLLSDRIIELLIAPQWTPNDSPYQ